MTTPPGSHPGRVLFNSGRHLGMVTRIVYEGCRDNPNKIFDVEAVRRTFEMSECQGIVHMWNYVLDYPDLCEFGSGSIDIGGDTKGAFTVEKAMLLQELYIGSRRFDISPLAWLGYLSLRIHEIPADLRPHLDRFLGSLARQMRKLDAVKLLRNTTLDGNMPTQTLH